MVKQYKCASFYMYKDTFHILTFNMNPIVKCVSLYHHACISFISCYIKIYICCLSIMTNAVLINLLLSSFLFSMYLQDVCIVLLSGHMFIL